MNSPIPNDAGLVIGLVAARRIRELERGLRHAVLALERARSAATRLRSDGDRFACSVTHTSDLFNEIQVAQDLLEP